MTTRHDKYESSHEAFAVAEWFWEAKKRQQIPIIFAGGQPDKIKTSKEKFPQAIFCAAAEVPERLARLMKEK